MLGGVPAFDGGSLSPVFLDCGCSLADDALAPSEEDSFMHTVECVDEGSFWAYIDKLKRNGFSVLWQRKTESNRFAELKKGDIRLYTEYFGNDRTAKIIYVGGGELACEFGYPEGDCTRANTALVQYSLHYGLMMRGVTADCGMLYALRLRDNSVILVDGGEIEQSTDIAQADFMSLLHELTETLPGEKIRISMWYCTHAHDDHIDFFVKLIRRHADELNLERVAFNFPSGSNIELGEPVKRLRENIREFYPGVRFLKMHTGQSFSLSSVNVSVLSTHEDMCTGDSERLYLGMNKTSSIVKMEFENRSLLLLADAEEINGEFLLRNYTPDELSCTYIQAAHHGINWDENIYGYVKAPYILLPQARRERDAAPDGVFAVYLRGRSLKDIFVAGEKTYIFTSDGKKTDITEREHVGCPYDGSGF